MDDELLRPEGVQKILRIGRSKVNERSAGELPVLRIGRVVRVSRRELERWIEESNSGGAPATPREVGRCRRRQGLLATTLRAPKPRSRLGAGSA